MNFFVYTGEQFELVATREEAIRMAEDAIDDWRDCCDPEWPEEVANVCWGEVKGHCIEEVVSDVDDPNQLYYHYSLGEMVP